MTNIPAMGNANHTRPFVPAVACVAGCVDATARIASLLTGLVSGYASASSLMLMMGNAFAATASA